MRYGGGIEELLVTARSSHAESVVTAVIIGVDWWNYMPRNLSLSITAYIDRDVTRYERGGERYCISIGRDLR